MLLYVGLILGVIRTGLGYCGWFGGDFGRFGGDCGRFGGDLDRFGAGLGVIWAGLGKIFFFWDFLFLGKKWSKNCFSKNHLI